MSIRDYLLAQSIRDYLLAQPNFPLRDNCPVCFNRNTFSADLIDDVIVYYCFHANCGIKGSVKRGLGIESIANPTNISDSTIVNGYDDRRVGIRRPEQSFQNPLQNSASLRLIKRYRLDIPYMEQRLGLRYDSKRERLVFEIRDSRGEHKGFTGRSLNGTISPKWYIYARQDGSPGIVRQAKQTNTRCILVEDMISAAVVSEVENAAALLGTTISAATIAHLLPFQELVIALDPDATLKAVKMQKELSAYRPTKALPIKNDLKYYNKEKIKELLDEVVKA